MVLASTQQQWKDTLSVNARLLAEQQQQLELQRASRATRVRVSTRYPLPVSRMAAMLDTSEAHFEWRITMCLVCSAVRYAARERAVV